VPLVETLPVGPGVAQWPIWSTTARLVVTDPAMLPVAHELVTAQLAAVERAGSRFRADSEVCRLYRAEGRSVRVSALLADLVAAALAAALRSDGDVDPTMGNAMLGLGYDRDLSLLGTTTPGVGRVALAGPDWRQIRLDGRLLSVPAGVLLDLGATAKAFAADRCAQLVAGRIGVGVLIGLGGDIATAGAAPDGGWRVLVRDQPGDPPCVVGLCAGAALATSSTLSRRWRHGRELVHHIVDPRTGQPATPVWRSVSALAQRCVDANMATTAAVVRGHAAPSWLQHLGIPARLLAADRTAITVGGWPDETTPPAG